MTAEALLTELEASGVRLAVTKTNRLVVDAPSKIVTAAFKESIRNHKTSLILLLRKCPFCHRKGMRQVQRTLESLLYLDTICAACEEIVETFVPPTAT